MRVALVHELLTMKGGAEKVLRVFVEMFPEAPIYTLLYDEKKLGDWFPKSRIRTSNVQPGTANIFPRSWRFNHHRYLSQFPSAVEAWNFSDFDLVISSSSAFTHGIITNSAPKHISYINSPARYLWDRTHDVLNEAGRGPLGLLKRLYLRRVFHRLRVWDAESAPRADALIAASKEVQRRIDLYWRLPSTVIYPPIDDMWLYAPSTHVVREKSEYFLIVSTLVPYKRIDLAIDACNEAKLPLKIVGEGPAKGMLKRRAGPTVEFYGFRQGDELQDLYRGALATIVPGEEDFNLVALESMAMGTPVIAFAAGGPLETIIDGKTGAFFKEPKVSSLQEVLQKFDQKKYSKEECIARAKEFSRARFEREIHQVIKTVLARS